MKNILVIKLGGILLKSNIAINKFFKVLNVFYKTSNQRIIIIHGGEFWARNIFNNTSILLKDKFLFDMKYSHNNNNYLKIGIFSGIINNFLVQHSKINNINAFGLCCTDMDIITLKSHDIKDYFNSYCNSLDFITYLLSKNIIPIINSCGINIDNSWIHIDSDIIAMLLSKSLNARLIMLTDVSGVLDRKGNIISTLNTLDFNKLLNEGVINGGMIIKVQTAINVSRNLNQLVNISTWLNFKKLKEILYGDYLETSVIGKG